jgi:protein transport protein SEC61 subunit gamma and related proteins
MEMEQVSLKVRMKSFLYECLRVLRVTKRPDKTEFTTIVKVSGLGMLILGFLGFLIQMTKVLFF